MLPEKNKSKITPPSRIYPIKWSQSEFNGINIMKQSIENKILEYLQEEAPAWVAKWQIEEQARVRFGCMAETADRKARLLAARSFQVIKDYRDGIVYYKYLNL